MMLLKLVPGQNSSYMNPATLDRSRHVIQGQTRDKLIGLTIPDSILKILISKRLLYLYYYSNRCYPVVAAFNNAFTAKI